jgi:hypothetical protein
LVAQTLAAAFPEVSTTVQKLPPLWQHWPGVTRSCCTTAVASLKGAPAPDTVRQLGPCASAPCIMLTVITISVVAIATAALPIFIVIEYGYYFNPLRISYVPISIVRLWNEESRSELTTGGQMTTVLK